VKSITADMNAGKGSAGKLLKDDRLYNDTQQAINRFNSTATKLDAILGDVRAGRGTLGKILNDEVLYNNVSVASANIANFTGNASLMIDDFRKNPKKYLTIQLKLF